MATELMATEPISYFGQTCKHTRARAFCEQYCMRKECARIAIPANKWSPSTHSLIYVAGNAVEVAGRKYGIFALLNCRDGRVHEKRDEGSWPFRAYVARNSELGTFAQNWLSVAQICRPRRSPSMAYGSRY